MKNYNYIAVITARKNSKSLKNKNMIKIGSKPLIQYSIDTCLQSKMLSKVLINSDSDEIINYCKKKGVESYYKRPSKLAKDNTTDLEVFIDLINYFKKNKITLPDAFVHIRPTCPIRDINIFDKAIKKFSNNFDKGYTSLRSVSLSKENPYKMWFITKENILKPIIKNNKFNSVPRQLIPKSFWQNGYIDIIKPQTISRGSIEGNKVLPYIIKHDIHDIDYLSDLKDFKKFIKNLKFDSLDRVYPS